MGNDPTRREGALADLIARCIAAFELEGAEAVERICGEHPEHAGAIRERLAVLGDVGLLDSNRDAGRPEQIGGYRILEQLGAGGMGVVYRAEQREPVRRQVAIKVVKLGMDSKEVLARFELERRALAAMSHNNIARIFDAGTTETGQPFFVMELVQGLPITTYCDKHRLPLAERIALMQQVCSGVQHAHQKGITHRDLKPANILVARDRDAGVPKIVDFGLAKATHRELAVQTFFTEREMILGTPEYMAPEQARPDIEDIDARADIYSLGAVLYELLSGEQPFPSAMLRRAGWIGMQRMLAEDEPPRPSARVRSAGESGSETAHRRSSSRRALDRDLRGDLDWIVLKAMAKEPERRYESATGLAQDLTRYLEHDPVMAGPPSAGYRIKKLARKYRTQVSAAALVLLALIGGTIGTAVGFARARDNEKLANERATRLDAALLDAEARSRELQQVVEFQEAQLLEVDPARMGAGLRTALIAEARDALERGGSETADARIAELEALLAGVNFTNLALDTLDANIFARALEAIDARFADQPLVAARLLRASGVTLEQLGMLERAAGPLRRAYEIRLDQLGPDDPDTLMVASDLGNLLVSRSDLTAAEPYIVAAYEGLRRIFGADHIDVINGLNNLGHLRWLQGQYDAAIDCLRETLASFRRTLPEGHANILTALDNLSAVLRSRGRLKEAEPLARDALAGRRRLSGVEPGRLVISLSNLGALLNDLGEYEEAESLLREALALSRRAHGDDFHQTIRIMVNLSASLQYLGRSREVEPLLREAVDRARRSFERDHDLTLQCVKELGSWYIRLKRLDEAEPLLREVYDGRARQLPSDHPDLITSALGLGVVLMHLKRFDDAERLLREAFDGRMRIFGPDDQRSLEARSAVGVLLSNRGAFAEADPYLREAVERGRRSLGDTAPQTIQSIRSLGLHLVREGNDALDRRDFAAAERLLLEAHGLLEEGYGAGHRRLVPCRVRLVELYESWHAAAPDAGHDAEAASWRKR